MAAVIFFLAATLIYLFIPLSRKARYLSAIALVGGICLYSLPSIQKDHQLEKAGYSTAGVVTAKECKGGKTQRIEYQFLARDEQVKGNSIINTNNNSCNTPKIGDQIFVTYLMDAPEINAPAREVNSHIFLLSLLALSLVPGLAWANKELHRSKQKSRTPAQ
ncbi:hypothetical protein ACO0LO_07655 [Undibacterium sp. TJN25]|uniref:hypothetical protein n=1 Tax=Undibacterium sp. TJN25 TaxID=3413056 RepID=UPI003BF2964C